MIAIASGRSGNSGRLKSYKFLSRFLAHYANESDECFTFNVAFIHDFKNSQKLKQLKIRGKYLSGNNNKNHISSRISIILLQVIKKN